MGNRRKTNPLIPLGDAARQFAPRSLQEKWRAAQLSPLVPPEMPLAAGEDMLSPWRIVEAVSKVAGSVLDRHVERNEPLNEMRDRLLREISAERLEALGVQISPLLGSHAESIPTFVFKNSPKVDWGKNSIENMGRAYGDVGVRRPSLDTSHASRMAESISPTARSGRPSGQAEIDRAIEALDVEDPNFRRLTLKVAVELVRQRAKADWPEKFRENRGLGYSTVEKRISHFRKSLP